MDLTPSDWLKYLEAQLDGQAKSTKKHVDYYNGRHQLEFATQKFKEAFSKFFKPMANNWCQLVVDALVERLEVQGFRFGDVATGRPWDTKADAAAWNIWQANNLDAASMMLHTTAVKCGVAYAMVEPTGGEYPAITVEDPSQVFVAIDPADRTTRLAAIKRWEGIDGKTYANVYLPNYVYKFEQKTSKRFRSTSSKWEPLDTSGVNKLGAVPVVPIYNNPDILLGGRSDLEVVEPIQDAINKLCLDMQVASEFHAYPQRTAVGWEVPRDSDGNVRSDFVAQVGPSKVLASESPDTKFGTLLPGDVSNYIQPIDMYIDHLAAQSRTPAYYLKGKMANMSADALKAADAGLVHKAKRRMIDFGDGWENVMRLAFTAQGDMARAKAFQAETLWADPESKSLGQLVDAAVKMRQSLDVPVEECWHSLGYSPQKIAQLTQFIGLPADGPQSVTN